MTEADSQLGIPPAAMRDHKAFEVLRVWVAEGGQHVSLRTAVWDDPAAWGILLADLARHIVNAYAQENTDLTAAEVFARIKAGLNAELGSPTDTPTGRIVNH